MKGTLSCIINLSADVNTYTSFLLFPSSPFSSLFFSSSSSSSTSSPPSLAAID
eukprot:m.123059 g.123059  ORF g.123059 m.123059 type:complete len:53 (+) comp15561_c2_seq1:168-326(+)